MRGIVMTDDDKEIFFREEGLHPDLQRYLRVGRGGAFELHHPLVKALEVDPARAAVVNRQFEIKSAEVRDAEESGDCPSRLWPRRGLSQD
jgi:hypothetical protein